MSEEYPLFPELPEAGREEAQALVDRFKEQLKRAANEVLGDLYCDVAVYIESDSWTNYRRHILDGLANYRNRKIQASNDFKTIRQAIYREFRDDIIKDLDQDNFARIAELERDLKREREWNRR